MGEMWESVLGVGENEKRCGKVCWEGKGRCRGVGKCNRVWGSVGGGVGNCVGEWESVGGGVGEVKKDVGK